MSNEQLATFTDRREAIALFDFLRGRDPGRPWPLLPILAFVAPGGSGKSLLLRYLRVEKSSLPGGRAAFPYAYLDFTLPHAPKDLLSILMELRDQLQQQDDGQEKHLVFPRFDLGALIAQAAATNEDVASLGPSEVRRKLAAGVQIIGSLSALSSSLGFAIPYVAPILAGLKFAGQIKPLKELLSYLEDSTGWKWYRMHGTETGLGANATLKDVLLRLHVLSMPGKPEREFLVNDLLPAAFLADLFDVLLDTDPLRAWSKTANIVLFLDGFEALQRASSSTATRLLHVLAIKERKHGKTDPLLLVIGSRDYLPGLSLEEVQAVPFGRTAMQDEQEVRRHVREWYAQWQQQIPADRRYLRPRDLYLTLELRDFGQEDTRSYLLKLGEQKQTRVFADNSLLVQTIDQLTHGHPLFLALAAEAVLEAKARGQELKPGDFELAGVSSEIAPEHEDEQIRDYLLDLFLRQLSEAERKELIFCAVPRFLDASILRVILPTLDDIDRQQRWNYYRQLTFMSPLDPHRVVFHPLVRTLLLRQLPVDQEPESDYYRTHTRLKDYFHALTSRQKPSLSQETVAEQAKIEEAYHALALGDPNPPIVLGVFAQGRNLTLWEPLLEAVTQAPVELMPDDVAYQAYDALVRAEQHHVVQDAVSAIVLYTWFLAASQETPEEIAGLQNNLGEAYRQLPGGDREANLRRAIACYEAALQVYTREAFPMQWAGTQNNLGIAYSDLPGGDREANLRQAIACYEAALQVRTREAFPVDWAGTQNNLGEAYRQLPGGDQEVNLRQAIACYEAALQVRTREAFPVDWAGTQNNLGIAYSDLPGGDQEANLRQAIACYEAALQVYTREAFPVDWAGTQNNLGAAYSDLPGGDREASLRQAIACYEAALQIYQLVHVDYYAHMVNGNLESARDELRSLEQGESHS
jgi:tetratricopeptide (TPR) repeat protein